MLGTWQATRPASSLTDSSPTDSDSSTHRRFGSASARPTTAVRSYSDSRFCLPVERAASSTATHELLHDLRNLASQRSSPEAACMLAPDARRRGGAAAARTAGRACRGARVGPFSRGDVPPVRRLRLAEQPRPVEADLGPDL